MAPSGCRAQCTRAVADPASIRAILAHVGEPTRAPSPAPARDPPTWASEIDGGKAMDLKAEAAGIDPLAQPVESPSGEATGAHASTLACSAG